MHSQTHSAFPYIHIFHPVTYACKHLYTHSHVLILKLTYLHTQTCAHMLIYLLKLAYIHTVPYLHAHTNIYTVTYSLEVRERTPPSCLTNQQHPKNISFAFISVPPASWVCCADQMRNYPRKRVLDSARLCTGCISPGTVSSLGTSTFIDHLGGPEKNPGLRGWSRGQTNW